KASCAREIAPSYSSAEAVRTLASRRPSIGEILSILAPPPRHSPSKTPALSSVRPSFSRGVFICRPAVPQQSGERTRLACWFRRLAETNFGKNRAKGKRPYEEKFA